MSEKDTALIHVYRLELEADGSVSKEKEFIRLPPPINPYILRFNIRAGSIASHGGILYTNYPIDEYLNIIRFNKFLVFEF